MYMFIHMENYASLFWMHTLLSLFLSDVREPYPCWKTQYALDTYREKDKELSI